MTWKEKLNLKWLGFAGLILHIEINHSTVSFALEVKELEF